MRRNGIDTSPEDCEVLAVDVSCTHDLLEVVLEDGRRVSVPLAWFPRLLHATPQQRNEWEFLGRGIGIHWESIDEDISIASLLHPERFIPMGNDFPKSSRPVRRRRVVRRKVGA